MKNSCNLVARPSKKNPIDKLRVLIVLSGEQLQLIYQNEVYYENSYHHYASDIECRYFA